jgi:hypothetical protein
MKAFFKTIVAAAFVVSLFSCTKTMQDCCGANPVPLSVAGQWNVVADTIYSGVNTGADPAIYVGQAGDYFDFRTNGYLYIKEGASLDTLSYNMFSPGRVAIVAFFPKNVSAPDTCQVKGYTEQNIEILTSLGEIPAGPQQRKVALSR